MSILSDVEITSLCVMPTKILDEDKYWIEKGKPYFEPDIYYPDPRDAIAVGERREEAIRQKCMRDLTDEEKAAFKPMIEPFHPNLIREVTDYTEQTADMELKGYVQKVPVRVPFTHRIISKGLSSFGYDITLSEHVEIFHNINSTIINPKKFDHECLTKAAIHRSEDGSRYIILPPNSYLLGYSVEYFRFPRDVTAVFIGKSTYARAGLIVNCTPAEAGWEGQLVIEAGNLTSLPMMVFIDEGIAQALFFKGNRECQTSYLDRGGKYQGQTGLTTAKV